MGKEYYDSHRKLLLAYKKEYYQLNRDAILAKKRVYYLQHRQQRHEYCRRNLERFNAYARKYYREHHIALIALLGGKCVKCGTNSGLEIDHINGDGYIDRKRFDDRQLLRYYLSNPSEAKNRLQVLCNDHNVEKAKLNGEFRWRDKSTVLHS